MNGEHYAGGRRSSLPAPSALGLFAAIWSADDRCLGSVMRQDGRWIAYDHEGRDLGSYPRCELAESRVRLAK